MPPRLLNEPGFLLQVLQNAPTFFKSWSEIPVPKSLLEFGLRTSLEQKVRPDSQLQKIGVVESEVLVADMVFNTSSQEQF